VGVISALRMMKFNPTSLDSCSPEDKRGLIKWLISTDLKEFTSEQCTTLASLPIFEDALGDFVPLFIENKPTKHWIHPELLVVNFVYG